MKDWYEVKVTFKNEEGANQTVSYLMQATSFAEAEDLAVECHNKVNGYIIISVDACAKRKFDGIFVDTADSAWFKVKAKIQFCANEKTTERSRPYLVQSESMEHAINYIATNVPNFVAVDMVQRSPIVAVSYLKEE